MRSLLLAALTVGLFWTSSAHGQTTPKLTFPQVGSDIPGPFLPYNLKSDPKDDRFHCLVSEHGLNPVVMVVVRGKEITQPLEYLLVKLDNIIEKNPNTRLAGFAVFLSTINDLAREDEERTKLVDELRGHPNVGKLGKLTLTLGVKKDLEKYKFDDRAEVIVLLYHRYKTVALHSMTRAELTEAKAKAILAEVVAKFDATRP